MNYINNRVIRNLYIHYYLNNIYCHKMNKYLKKSMLSMEKYRQCKYLYLNNIHVCMIYKHLNQNNHRMVVCRQCKFLNLDNSHQYNFYKLMKNYNLHKEKHMPYIDFHNIHINMRCKLFMNYINNMELYMLSKYYRSNNIRDYILNIQQPNYMICMAIYKAYMYFHLNNSRQHS